MGSDNKSVSGRAGLRYTKVQPKQISQGAVLVTGACGRLGRLLVRQLHRTRRVVTVDRRPFDDRPKDVRHYQLELPRQRIREVFRSEKIDAVIHLGVMHDLRKSARQHHLWNVVALQRLLEYVAEFQVPKVVLLSSANVYGAHADNSQFLSEEAPLLGAQTFSQIRDLIEIDMLAQSFFWKHAEIETVILRPCHIVGRVRNAASNYLRLGRPIRVLGFDPMIQLIHERDVVQVLLCALAAGVRGIYNVRGPGEAPLSKVLQLIGKKPAPSLPMPVATSMFQRLWRHRVSSFPPEELDYLRFNCMVDGRRANEELGFIPRFDFEQTVRAAFALR